MNEENIFINRELSWLDFNRRVLVLGKDKNVPLAEQVKFFWPFTAPTWMSFFMVRVGSLQERANLMRGKKGKAGKQDEYDLRGATDGHYAQNGPAAGRLR